jgi:hypothetical protein
MEVEFLSNMRYTLYASESEWTRWHQKLGRFWDYFDKASRSHESRPRGSSTPNLHPSLPLPSPPASQHASPPFPSAAAGGPPRLHPLSMPPYMAPSVASPMPRMHEVELGPNPRKRSMDESGPEPSSKRLARTAPGSAHPPPRLPMPNLATPAAAGGGRGGPLPGPGPYAAHLPLPPAVHGHHAPWQQPAEMPTPTGPPGTLPPMADQLRRQSPLRPGSRTVSPTGSGFGPGTAHDLLSPSGYPAQRSSPYRPVRGVNTLLVPPPPATRHHPTRPHPHDRMHYLPLGKPAGETKTGIVPYMPYDSWQPLPPAMGWPPLPQPTLPPPNFRI